MLRNIFLFDNLIKKMFLQRFLTVLIKKCCKNVLFDLLALKIWSGSDQSIKFGLG
jgi:hypothetical protein